jgi:CRISPR-associated protein Cas1
MKKHLNTLYITSPDAYVRKEGMTFVVELDKKKALQAPVHTIENIVCFGFKPVTPALMAFCAENNIGISYLSMHGRFLARVYGGQRGNVLLRKSQYAIFDSETRSADIAKMIVAAKIENSRKLLQRHLRNHGGENEFPSVISAVSYLAGSIRRLESAGTLDEIRGRERQHLFRLF